MHPVDNITDYLDPQSNVSRDISAVAAEASSWALFSAEACRQEYQACQGLQFHRDIVLVIDAWGQPNETDAWVLDNIYNMSALPDSSLAGNKNYSAIWEPYVPASSPNSLWFSSPCSKRALTGGGCDNSCSSPMGMVTRGGRTRGDNSTESLWSFSWWDYQDIQGPFTANSIPQPPAITANNIAVRYCLAEQVDQNVCKVCVSNLLVVVVAICVIFKAVLCIYTVASVKDDPLVTPGDAIVSFLTRPDPATVNSCTMSLQTLSDISGRGGKPSTFGEPRPWRNVPGKMMTAVSIGQWFRTYLFFGVILGILGWVMSLAMLSSYR